MKILLVVALGIAGVALLGIGLGSPMRDPMALPLVVVGAVLIVAALVWAVRLVRGDWRGRRSAAVETPDALARWLVSQSEMDAFRRIDAARHRRIWSLKNALSLPQNVGEGWPVVIGRRSLVMGDTFISDVTTDWFLGDASWHEGDPGFIELSSTLQLGAGKTIVVHRFPVPATARPQAIAGFEHLRSIIAPENRARIHQRFANHFAAAMQTSDTPHPIMQRRKIVIGGLAAFFLLMIAFLVSRAL